MKISASAKIKNITTFDAPVSGGDLGAKGGTLSIMVGCDEKEKIDEVLSVINCYAKTVKYVGKAGNGHQCKMVNQIIVAQNTIGLCEGL